ncbi:MAG TPA: hypothetical protein PLY95_03880 [Candidatus Paceibacterota bacterium]|nr:hypothetical protein [Candidatus Paceibacterota bacterium]
MSNTNRFVENFKPYRSRYIYQKQDFDLFSIPGWQTSESYLTDNMIENALTGLAIYGYFLNSCPIVFGIDIDDHTGRGDGYLLSVLDSVTKRFNNLDPSVLCRSPHGLHAYYFLTYPIAFPVLEERLKTVLAGLPVEIKPTTRTGIRFPRIGNFLNARTFLPVTDDFEKMLEKAERYHPAELFTEISPAEIRESLKERKGKTLRLRELQKIAKIEAGFPCIFDGNTNDALCQLIPVYRSAGLTPEESAIRFYSNLAPVYNGELRNYERLLKRIQSFYKNQPEPFKQNKIIQMDFYSMLLADTIAGKVVGATETRQQKAALTVKKNTVKKAVLRLENWKYYIDCVKENRQMVEYWNYLYPYFKKNIAEGFYPIPQGIFLQIHGHYNDWLLPFLLEVRYLEKSPYGYSAGNGTCLHYRINQQIKT